LKKPIAIGVSLAFLFALASAYYSASAQGRADKRPEISIKSVPIDPPSEEMAKTSIVGTVVGGNPKEQKVVIYAKGDKWYVQPTVESSITDFDEHGNWESETHGGYQFAALLVKASYKPAPTLRSIPAAGGEILAVAKKDPKKQ